MKFKASFRAVTRQKDIFFTLLPWAVLAVVLAFVAGALAVVVMRRKVAEVEPPARSMMIGRGQVEALPTPTLRGEWLPALIESETAAER
jgi:hypothetical protein